MVLCMKEKLGGELWWTFKFGSLWGGWSSMSLLGCMGWGLWKNIRKGWRKFSSHIGFEVGEGSNASFWHDPWFGDMALKEAFPYLYGIACANDASVAAHLEISSAPMNGL